MKSSKQNRYRKIGRPINNNEELLFMGVLMENRECQELQNQLTMLVSLRFFKKQTEILGPDAVKELFLAHREPILYEFLLNTNLLDYQLSSGEEPLFRSSTDIRFLIYTVRTQLGTSTLTIIQTILIIVSYFTLQGMINREMLVFFEAMMESKQYQAALASNQIAIEMPTEEINDALTEKIIIDKIAGLTKLLMKKYGLKMTLPSYEHFLSKKE